MMESKGSKKALDKIIDEMIEVVENSKHEIFNIGEDAREEYNILQQELKEVKRKVIQHIEQGDQLEKKVKLSRKRLSEVSKEFNRYNEFEIQEVYERTHKLQTDYAILQQDELVLRERRDEIERRLISLDQTIERAETLANKISVVLPYLHDDFRQVNEIIEDAKEKQLFSLKIIKAQEDERRRISREIHDGPAQMLANILLRSELIDRAIREQTIDQALDEIQSIRKMLKSSLREVRRIIYDLRPMALDDLGLIPTIKKYVANNAEYTNIDIEFISLGEEKRLEQEYEVTLFRVMQESLQNAIKHSDSSKIIVKLEIGKKFLSLMVTDNGKGFDTAVKKDQSFGLIGMKERVEMLRGKFH
ncbi:MAG TPA: sensor histidine kinase, partial [Alloiococcus sp.]|nr:sensor histidine kinase [Alloiococcus sp.]